MLLSLYVCHFGSYVTKLFIFIIFFANEMNVSRGEVAIPVAGVCAEARTGVRRARQQTAGLSILLLLMTVFFFVFCFLFLFIYSFSFLPEGATVKKSQ